MSTVDTDPTQSAVDRARPSAGDKIGRYTLQGILGTGGMGVVYDAHDPQLDRRVAIKLLRPESYGSGSPARLVREGHALARMSHPNVVGVYEAGRHDDAVFIAMELVDGVDLVEWLEQSHPWEAVVDVFIEAARGLAAVHAEGLVHRDFKPGNVTIAHDGAVKVLDFGLARCLDDGTAPSRTGDKTAQRAAVDDSATGLLHTNLTRAGAVMGTPAYMSAEQFKGEPIDHRVDQHAFFVALYEGLYGQRPFKHNTWNKIRAAVTNGDLGPRPDGVVPHALFAMIRRGTSPDPARRFADMNAVIQRLAAIRHPPRRRMLWGGAAAALGVVGLYAGLAGSTPDLCADSGRSLGDAWSDARRASIIAAFDAIERPHAKQTRERVVAGLDDYAAGWVRERTAACRESRASDELDLRMACLDRRRESLAALASVLSEATDATLAHSVSAVAGLPTLRPCGDLTALRAALPPPSDPATAQAVAELRRRLTHVTALRSSGDADAALAAIADIEDAAAGLAYAPVLAEAKRVHGSLAFSHGDYEDAELLLTAAFTEADAAGHDAVAAAAGSTLVRVVGDALARPDDALSWARHTEGVLERLHSDGVAVADKRAELHYGIALTHMRAGQHADASLELDRAQSMLDDSSGQLVRLAILNGRAMHHYRRGRFAAAKADYTQAVAGYEDVYGAVHPVLGIVRGGLATALSELGELDVSVQEYERALAVTQAVFSEGHPRVGRLLVNIGTVLERQGKVDEATRALRQGHAILEAAHGPDDPTLSYAIGALAGLDRDAGRTKQARLGYERASRLLEDSGHTEAYVHTLNNLGSVKVAEGDVAAGLTDIDRALKLATEKLGADHLVTIVVQTDLGQTLSQVGRHTEAIAALQSALATASAAFGPEHVHAVEIRGHLAHSTAAQQSAQQAAAG